MRTFEHTNAETADNSGARAPNSENISAEKHKSPMKPVQAFLLNLLVIITIIWLLFGYAMGAVTAPNNDMSPNIKMKDLLLYYRLEHQSMILLLYFRLAFLSFWSIVLRMKADHSPLYSERGWG